MSPAEGAILDLVRDGFFRIDGFGRIWRHEVFGRTGKRRVITPRIADHPRKDGYLEVRVVVNGKELRALSHRIVRMNENGPVEEGIEVNHKNGRRSENQPTNLEPLTPSGNMLHSYEELGRKRAAGTANGRAKLTQEIADQIRAAHAAGEPKRALARRFAVSPTQIRNIISGKHWNGFPEART